MNRASIKTTEQIKIIAEGGKILADVLQRTAEMAKPGVSTWELNQFAEKEIYKAGGEPSFKNYGDPGEEFPAGLCTSINEVIVHGEPRKEDVLKEGDIIGLDLGVKYKGLFTDSAVTVGIGNITPLARKLLSVTEDALYRSIEAAIAGNRIGDISHMIQKTAEDAGFSVVRSLVGHGVGSAVHEDPAIPCYGKKGTGKILEIGMVLAIEPMVCAGDYLLTSDPGRWDVRTTDNKIAAHFEHTIAITEEGPKILTK